MALLIIENPEHTVIVNEVTWTFETNGFAHSYRKEIDINKKYMIFAKVSVAYQKLRAWKILQNFQKRGITALKVTESKLKSEHQIQRIWEPFCRSFKLLYTKIWNSAFFARRNVIDACLFAFHFCLFCFSKGWS